MNVLLRASELLYRGINRLRRGLYRSGLLRAQTLPRPVISVGNLAAGGAGKTPAVIAISRFLASRGYRVTVLTRGYGRASAATGLVSDDNAGKWGDESVLINTHAKADVIVGSNRTHLALKYLSKNNCDVFVLDDGFQHLQLHRDLDIVIDIENARFWREGRSALRDADLVLPRRLVLRGLEPLRGKALFAFAALADNEQFFQSLRKEKLLLAGTHGFPDHHRYTQGDLDDIVLRAGEAAAEAIVTTEKDAVKFNRPEIVAVGADFEISPDALDRIEAVVRL